MFFKNFLKSKDKKTLKTGVLQGTDDTSELLPLLEEGASWEVSAFDSQIYLPSSAGSPCPDMLSIACFIMLVK